MASFQANIGWEMPKKRENKNYHSDQFQPNPLQRIRKKQQKNSKDKKTSFQLLLNPKQVGKGREREKIKIIVLISSYPTRYREFQKYSKKIQKNKKTPLWLLFKPKQVGNSLEREKIKKKSF